MLNRYFHALAISAAAVGAAPLAAEAAVITAAGTSGVVTSAPAGLDGYIFYWVNNSSDLVSPASYVSVVTNGASRYSQPSYADLTVGLTTYDTGIGYHDTAVTTPEVATLTVLTAGTFTIGVLMNNVNSANVPNDLNVVGSNTATQDPGTSENQNIFYYFNVNASVNDVIKIVVPSSPNFNRGFGGITFDNFVVPEPATLSMLAVGGAAMLRRRR